MGVTNGVTMKVTAIKDDGYSVWHVYLMWLSYKIFIIHRYIIGYYYLTYCGSQKINLSERRNWKTKNYKPFFGP